MNRADYSINGNVSRSWIPRSNHISQDFADSLLITAVEQYNDIDTAVQRFVRIEPAYKPSIFVGLSSGEIGTAMIFGGVYDTRNHPEYSVSRSQLFLEDTVGITPLLLQQSNRTRYDCDMNFQAKDGEL